jgi:hypothetical protein
MGPGEAWRLIGLTAALWLALLALRFVWIWGALCVSAHWAKWPGEPRNVPSLRYMGAATLAGIRGAVTLAGVLSVPLAMPDGSPFPARDLLIFLIEATRGTETDPLRAARAASFERGLWLTGLRAERSELYRLRSTSRINDNTLRSLVREIDLIEASIRAAARAPDPLQGDRLGRKD